MNWAWAGLDQIGHSPELPLWLALAAAGVVAAILLTALWRVEKSATVALLSLVAFVAIGIAAAATLRAAGEGAVTVRGAEPVQTALPALACLDDLAGETVLAACEKRLFQSPDSVAAAVSYTAAQITRLTALGDVAAANRHMTPELAGLRRAIERDRYGLVGYVLVARNACQPGACAVYQSLTDHNQIAANIDERTYEALVSRYAPGWEAAPAASGLPAAAAVTVPGLTELPAAAPSGRPTTADFPSAASIPPVNIMTPEPLTPAAVPRAPLAASPAPSSPASANAQAPARPAPVTGQKKQPAAKSRPSTPVQLAPNAGAADN